MTRPFRERRRKAPMSKGSKLLVTLAVMGFVSSGFYLGFQFAKPPPPPDFSALSPSAGPAAGQGLDEANGGINSGGRLDNSPEMDAPGLELATDEPLVIQRQPPSSSGGRPRIALVIDDLGRSLQDIDTLAALGVPVTYSVLPFESKTSQVVDVLRRRGAEILCHLPMEATSGANPGPGALLLSMSHQELTAATRKALSAVPGAIGANNHMGSGISASREAITPVISVLVEKGLFFLDSRTSKDTVGYSVARHLGVPAAERHVFLDVAINDAAVREQFARLLKIARERGSAIAIGHPHKVTLDVLASEVRAAERQGFEFVTASSLLEG